MTDAPKNDHIQPALSGTATPMDSPQVAVRSLLHETPLDRPPTAPTSPTIPNRHRRKRSSSQKRSPATPAGPALDRQSQAEKQTLQQTVSDLQSLLLQYLRLLPWFPRDHPIRVKLKRFLAPQTRIVLRWMGGILHRQNVLASNLAYDVAVLFWKWVVNLFFREIRPRGAYKIPKDTALIFVAAPHHNQFVDPLLLMSEVRLSAGRRISFLVAEKSLKRAFVGAACRTMQSISVVRAADNAVPGKGVVYLSPYSEDLTILRGHGTTFTKDLKARSSIQLPKSLAFATCEVAEVVDDVTVRLKKGFSGEKVIAALLDAGRRLDGLDTDWEESKDVKREGLAFKCLPYVDQTKMYSQVYKKLKEGGCIGIFPEGGSHDRADLLPLKAGVSIMALGALAATPGLKVQIIPTGLSYFHPHKFRSRAVVEFGSPIDIPQELVADFEKGGEHKRAATAAVLDLIFDGLKGVTVRAPDYDTLMLIQATRRLYRPPGQSLSLGQVVEMNKRFIMGYETYKNEPRVVALKEKVTEYNRLLKYMGLRDHQVDSGDLPAWRSLVLLVYRSLLVGGWTVVALPGVILNSPMFIAATIISRMKAKEALAASTVKLAGRDVVATWKILVSLGMAPIVYTIYGIISVVLAFKYGLSLKYKLLLPLALAIALPSIGYSALKFGETGMDIYKSLRPLFLSLMPGNQVFIDRLKRQRRELAEQLSELINEFGPQLFDDFESHRIIQDRPPSRRSKSSYGRDQGIFSSPFDWLDSQVFGWSRGAPLSSAGSTFQTQPASDLEESADEGDYDRVVGTLPKVEEGVTMEASDLRRHENDSAKTTAVDDEAKLHQRKGLE